MTSKNRVVDLDAEFLGLERTLEDDILDIMDGFVRETATNVVDEVAKEIAKGRNYESLDKYIRNIVYDILKSIFGTTLIMGNMDGRSFLRQLCFQLEKEGFVRDCPTCYFNTQRLGKIKH